MQVELPHSAAGHDPPLAAHVQELHGASYRLPPIRVGVSGTAVLSVRERIEIRIEDGRVDLRVGLCRRSFLVLALALALEFGVGLNVATVPPHQSHCSHILPGPSWPSPGRRVP